MKQTKQCTVLFMKRKKNSSSLSWHEPVLSAYSLIQFTAKCLTWYEGVKMGCVFPHRANHQGFHLPLAWRSPVWFTWSPLHCESQHQLWISAGPELCGHLRATGSQTLSQSHSWHHWITAALPLRRQVQGLINWSGTTLWPPAWYSACPRSAKTALTHRGTDSPRPLKVCCGGVKVLVTDRLSL